jgi:hypothetical protein
VQASAGFEGMGQVRGGDAVAGPVHLKEALVRRTVDPRITDDPTMPSQPTMPIPTGRLSESRATTESTPLSGKSTCSMDVFGLIRILPFSNAIGSGCGSTRAKPFGLITGADDCEGKTA